MNFTKYYLYSIVLTAAYVFLSCDKSSDDVCHGCGIDTSTKEYQFNISGRILEDCSGQPASNRTIELLLFYKYDTLSVTGQTSVSGDFVMHYTKMLPGDYWMYAQWESYCLLKVKEDSVTFHLSGLEHHEGMNLQVGDSLDIDFYYGYINNPLLAGDTLFMSFQPVSVGYTYPCIIGGPLANNELIYSIKDKWRLVELDDDDRPVFRYYTHIERGSGGTPFFGMYTLDAKVPCVMHHEEVTIFPL